MKQAITDAIEALRRQRVRQGDFLPALRCVLEQANRLCSLGRSGPVYQEADLMRIRAAELRRIFRSVPKFVVEELIDESIARLEALSTTAAHAVKDGSPSSAD